MDTTADRRVYMPPRATTDPDIVDALRGAESALWVMVATMPDCPLREDVAKKHANVRRALDRCN